MIKTNSEREFFQLTVNRNTIPVGKVDFEEEDKLKRQILQNQVAIKQIRLSVITCLLINLVKRFLMPK